MSASFAALELLEVDLLVGELRVDPLELTE